MITVWMTCCDNGYDEDVLSSSSSVAGGGAVFVPDVVI
jgi:hypothetical protein